MRGFVNDDVLVLFVILYMDGADFVLWWQENKKERKKYERAVFVHKEICVDISDEQ